MIKIIFIHRNRGQSRLDKYLSEILCIVENVYNSTKKSKMKNIGLFTELHNVILNEILTMKRCKLVKTNFE